MAYFSTKHVAFGGTDEYVTMGNVLAFERTDSFSVSFWVSTTSSAQTYILSKVGAATAYQGWGVILASSGKVRLYLVSDDSTSNSIIVESDVVINDGVWHHVLICYGGTSTAAGVTMYIDGAVVSTPTVVNDNLTATILNSVSFNISGRTDGSTVFTGSLDEVSIYDAELTSGDVTSIYNSGTPTDLAALASATNLVAWWKMGDGDTFPVLQDSGRVGYNLSAEDLSPSGFDGTPTNMESGDVSSDVAGGRASTFNGTDEWVTMGDVLNFDYTDTFSVSFWVWHASATNGVAVAKMGTGTPYGWAVYLTGSGSVYFTMAHTTATNHLGVYTDTVIPLGAWHHVVVTKAAGLAASNVEFYFDGVLQTGKTVQYDTLSSSVSNAFDLTLGRRMLTGSELYLDGKLDDVAVYSAVLDQTAVTAIYNGGTPTDLLALGSSTNLVGYWRMGDGATSPTIPDLAWSNPYPTITDASGNGNDGTMTNMSSADVTTVTAGGVSTHSCLFNTAAKSVRVGTFPAWNYNTPFSISLWFKVTNTGAGVGVWRRIDGSSNYVTIEIGGTDPSSYLIFYVTYNNGSVGLAQVINDLTIRDNNWHHIVCAYDGSATGTGQKVWIDGAGPYVGYDTDTLTAGTLSTMLEFVSYQLGGYMDEGAVYSKALSHAEVQWIYNSGAPRRLDDDGAPSNLAGWWRMGDDGIGNDGTITNMDATNFVDGVPGDYSYASFTFDGVDEYVDMGDVLDWDYLAGRSYSFWYKTTTTSTSGLITKHGSGTPDGWTIAANFNGKLILDMVNTVTTSQNTIESSVVLNDGLWHHVVLTWSGATGLAADCSMYFDGVEDTSLNIVANTLAGTIATGFAFQLGDRTLSDLPFAGELDEVSIYDVELTPAQVADLYAFGAPINIMSLSSWGDCIGYWRLGEASFDGTMTNMESTDIVEGDGPGWEWKAIFRGSSQLGRSLIFRPSQTPRQDRGMFAGASEGIHVGGLSADWASIRSPLALTRGTQFGQGIPPGGGTTITNYFRMRGVDNGTSNYTTWTAQGNPDPDGTQATPSNTTPTLVGSVVAGSGVTLHSWQQES